MVNLNLKDLRSRFKRNTNNKIKRDYPYLAYQVTLKRILESSQTTFLSFNPLHKNIPFIYPRSLSF